MTSSIDIATLPLPAAVKVLDSAEMKRLFLERFVLFWDEQRLVDPSLPRFEVTNLEANPVSIIGKAWTYLRLLDLARINDAVKAGLVAFALGPDLDHLAAFYGLARRVIAPATGTTPVVMEPDFELRRRVLLAPEAFSTAGSHGAYVFHALASDVDVINADVWSPGPGEVVVAVQSRTGDGTASAELAERVRARLNRRDIKPLTDIVTVRSVVVRAYRIDVEAFALPGPDAATVRAAMIEALGAMAALRQTPSRDVPLSAVYAAAQVGPVDRVVVHSPVADIATAHGEVAVLTGMDVRVSTYGR